MLFNYTAVNSVGAENKGTIDAISQDTAITALQRRGLIVVSVTDFKNKKFFEKDVLLFEHIKTQNIVVLSRQIATMFDAQISALQTFNMLAVETENRVLGGKLHEIAIDIQGGMAISNALAKHPKVFSTFYVNMVRSGEESGNLSKVFTDLADYLERNYELASKARGALVYPFFVIAVFIAVMLLMFVLVIPTLSDIIKSSGQEIPISTTIVIAVSNFIVSYGLVVLVILILLGCLVYYLERTGSLHLSHIKLDIPIIGNLYRTLYLSRIADNMSTMLTNGVSVVRTVEITADVVDNQRYAKILFGSIELIKSGSSVADAFEGYEDLPRILILMIKVGEETGELAQTLQVMAKFYRRDVENSIHNLISLIEPAMLVILGVGVGVVMASVLLPIYNLAGNL